MRQLRKLGFPGLITATARYEDEADELRNLGVDAVYNIYEVIGRAYGSYVLGRLGPRLPPAPTDPLMSGFESGEGKTMESSGRRLSGDRHPCPFGVSWA